jgi:hypothetical protein
MTVSELRKLTIDSNEIGVQGFWRYTSCAAGAQHGSDGAEERRLDAQSKLAGRDGFGERSR